MEEVTARDVTTPNRDDRTTRLDDDDDDDGTLTTRFVSRLAVVVVVVVMSSWWSHFVEVGSDEWVDLVSHGPTIGGWLQASMQHDKAVIENTSNAT